MLTCSRMTKFKVAAVLPLMLAGIATQASPQVDKLAGLVDRLLVCDSIVELSRRLACYDVIAENLKQNRATVTNSQSEETLPAEILAANPTSADDAPAVSSATAVPRPDTDKSRVDETFGFSVETRESTEQKSVRKKEEIKSIQAKITRVWGTSDGRFAVELDNGQRWRETSGSRIGMPKAGRSVEISKSRFGGYRMKIERIKRLASVRRIGE